MVYLLPLTDEAFEAYRVRSIRDYAAMQVAAGIWSPAEAVELSRKEFERLLPEGAATRDHFLYSIEATASGETVGLVWIALRERPGIRELYLYDIQIEEASRRRGYGTAVMRLLEERARELGAGAIRLRVHAHNSGARKLYRALGYEETDIMMMRKVEEEA